MKIGLIFAAGALALSGAAVSSAPAEARTFVSIGVGGGYYGGGDYGRPYYPGYYGGYDYYGPPRGYYDGGYYDRRYYGRPRYDRPRYWNRGYDGRRDRRRRGW